MISAQSTISIRAGTHQLYRKKKSSKSQDKEKEKEKEKDTDPEREDLVQEPERIKSESPVGSSGRNSPAPGSSRPDRKTKAEKRFEEAQRKRVSPFFEVLHSFFADTSSVVTRKGRKASPHDTQRPCSRV
jgi:hypothetical protein